LQRALRFIARELMVVCISQISLLRFFRVSSNKLFCMEVIFSESEEEVLRIPPLCLLKRSLW
jgi:hypothetical protein